MSAKISNEAVLKATGKNWQQWFAILDKAGAKKLKHIDIARFLQANYLGKNNKNVNVVTSGGWWSQMVTVEYERARKMRPLPEKRKRHAMPEFILRALEKHHVTEAYEERPPYQRNDYLGWIIHAKRPETKQKRLDQMIKELKGGRIYMDTIWKKNIR